MKPLELEDALEEVDSPYGHIAFFRNDMFLGRSLREYGEWAKKELDFLNSLIVPGSVVVDAGAFIGTHTLAFSRFVGELGTVYSFEPHPTYFMTLQRNITSNHLSNVFSINSGLSDQPGEMQVEELDLSQTNSLGSVQLVREIAHGNKLTVKITTLDSLELKTCSLIKADVEGMENLVLSGGLATIKRCKPIIYAECNSADTAWPVVQMMYGLRYVVYLYSEVAYNPNNFHKNALNIFGSARELALVCVPSENDIDFLKNVNQHLEIIRINQLDDLVLALIKKPQYKHEVLASTTGAKVWGNVFWANEDELTDRDGQIASLNLALVAERESRGQEHAEAVKQIQALTEWATSADAYAKSKVEEVEHLQVALVAERESRGQEHAEAVKQIQALTEWATSADAYAKSKVEEVKELQLKIDALKYELASYQQHWIFNVLPHPKLKLK